MSKWLALFLMLHLSSLSGQQHEQRKDETKKYNFSVCAIFKNEARYLREWIEYHRLVGVDHFYLYNNNSRDHFRRVLAPYIKQKLVTLVEWPDCLQNYSEEEAYAWALSTQISAYENAIKVKAAQETRWLLFLNVNEFLVPGNQVSFSEILKKYEAYPGISFVTDCYNASNMAEALPKKLVVESLKLTQDTERNIQKESVKMIFKPKECVAFFWPPYECLFKDDQKSVQVSKREIRINRYTHRYDGSLYFGKAKQSVDLDARRLSEPQLARLLEEGFEIEDREGVILRFIPDLLKKLGLDTGWNTMEGRGQ